MLSPYLCEFITRPTIDRFLVSRDAKHGPEFHYVVGSEASEGGTLVTLYVQERSMGRLLENAADNGRISCTIGELLGSHEMYQIKGRFERAFPPDDVSAARVAAWIDAMVAWARSAGLPEEAIAFLAATPHRAYRVVVRVDEVYCQTPGPAAGQPVREGA